MKNYGQRVCPDCHAPYKATGSTQIRCKVCARLLRIERAKVSTAARRRAQKQSRRHCIVDLGAYGFLEGELLGTVMLDGELMYSVRLALTKHVCEFNQVQDQVQEAA